MDQIDIRRVRDPSQAEQKEREKRQGESMSPGGDLERGNANASLLQPRGGFIFLWPQHKGFDRLLADGVCQPKECPFSSSYPCEAVKIEDPDRRRSSPCIDRTPQFRTPSLPTCARSSLASGSPRNSMLMRVIPLRASMPSLLARAAR